MKDPDPVRTTTLVLVFKRPRLGHGKQRLAATAGGDAAYALAERLLACALEDVAHWPGTTVLAPDRAEDVGWARGMAPGASVVAQADGNLGARLVALDDALATAGHHTRLYVGSDAPLLSGALLEACASALVQADVVLVPADDGGVVAMGTRPGWPPLAGLPWSTDRLGSELDRHCCDEGLTVRRIEHPDAWDIDTADALPRLADRLRTDRRPARVRLRRWLDAHLGAPPRVAS